MKNTFRIGAALLAIGLGACSTETTTTTKTRTSHYEPALGSHVPRSENTASSAESASPTGAGERAFAGGSAAGSNAAGAH